MEKNKKLDINAGIKITENNKHATSKSYELLKFDSFNSQMNIDGNIKPFKNGKTPELLASFSKNPRLARGLMEHLIKQKKEVLFVDKNNVTHKINSIEEISKLDMGLLDAEISFSKTVAKNKKDNTFHLKMRIVNEWNKHVAPKPLSTHNELFIFNNTQEDKEPIDNIQYQQMIKEHIFKLLKNRYLINILYVPEGVGVFHHIKDFYKDEIFTGMVSKDNLEEKVSTSIENIYLDCMMVEDIDIDIKNIESCKQIIIVKNLDKYSGRNENFYIKYDSSNLYPSLLNRGVFFDEDYKKNIKEIPTEEEFKKRAWELKEQKGIKLTAALNELSMQYGYSCFNAIKPNLSKHVEE